MTLLEDKEEKMAVIWVPVAWCEIPDKSGWGWGADISFDIPHSAKIPHESNPDLPRRIKSPDIQTETCLGDPAVKHCRVTILDDDDLKKIPNIIPESKVSEKDKVLVNRPSSRKNQSLSDSQQSQGIVCPNNPEQIFPCPRYRLVVTKEICERCHRDADFKQSLFSRYVRNRAARALPCKYKGTLINSITVPCCGGRKKALIGVYHCNINGYSNIVRDPDCWICERYSPKETS